MRNFRKEDLVLDAKIYVYKHGSDIIVPAVISGIEGRYERYSNKLYQHASDAFEETIGAVVSFKLGPLGANVVSTDTGTFYVNFSDEKNRRGVEYTGFPTEEDAQEFKKYLLEQKIEELQHQIENIKKKM